MRTIALLATVVSLAPATAARAATTSTLDGSCNLAGTFSTTPAMGLQPQQGSVGVHWDADASCTGTLNGAPIDHRAGHFVVDKDSIFLAGCAWTGGQQVPGALSFVNGIPDAQRPFGAPVSDPSGDDDLDDSYNVVDPSGDDVPDPDDTVLVINVFVQGPVLAHGWLITGGKGTGPVGVDPRGGGAAPAAVTYASGQEQATLTGCAGSGGGPLPFTTSFTTIQPLVG